MARGGKPGSRVGHADLGPGEAGSFGFCLLGSWAHWVATAGENGVFLLPSLSLCLSRCLCLSHRYSLFSQRPLHAPLSGLDPRLLPPGLALLSWGPGEAGALTCNEATCRGNDAHTLPRLRWLQGRPGRSLGPFFSAPNAGGGAEPAGPNLHLKGALGGKTTTV